MSFTWSAVIISSQIVRLTGLKKGIVAIVIILGLVTVWAVSFMHKSIPTAGPELQDTADAIKGFVIASALIGCVIGGALAGLVSKSLGRRNGLILAAIAFFLSAIGAWRPGIF